MEGKVYMNCDLEQSDNFGYSSNSHVSGKFDIASIIYVLIVHRPDIKLVLKKAREGRICSLEVFDAKIS